MSGLNRLAISAAIMVAFSSLAGQDVPSQVSKGILNIKNFGAKGDSSTDDTAAFQRAFDEALPKYTERGINNFYKHQEHPVIYIPNGKYRISKTLDLSFRNDMTLRCEGTLLYDGPVDTTVIEAKCSSRFNISGLRIDGNQKAGTYVHISGNGTADDNPALAGKCKGKGNVTYEKFADCHFYNQYKESEKAMVDSIPYPADTGEAWYYSMDDSTFARCDFISGGKKNFSVALSSSENSFFKCNFMTPNGIKMNNGSTAKLYSCTFSCMNGNDKGAIYIPPNSHIGEISLFGCYLESTRKPLVNFDQNSERGLLASVNIYGGLFAQLPNSKEFISVPKTVKGAINIYNPRFQSPVGKVSAPSCFVILQKMACGLDVKDYLLDVDAKQLAGISGQVDGNVVYESETTGDEARFTLCDEDCAEQFKYSSLDRLLSTVAFTRGSAVTIALLKDAEINKAHTIRGDIRIVSASQAAVKVNSQVCIYEGGILRIEGVSLAASPSGRLLNNGGQLLMKGIDCVLDSGHSPLIVHNAGFTGVAESKAALPGGMIDASSQFAHGEILLRNLDAPSAKAIADRLSAGNVKATIQNPELK